MPFWRGETLNERLPSLADPFDAGAIDCAAYTLRVGGEIYVSPDRQVGWQTEGDVAMLAFAGIGRGRTSLNILRVSEDDFCSFLMAWADWLAQRPIRTALNRLDPLAA